LYYDLEALAARHGWTLAVGNQTQDEPEQWPLVVTKEDPAKRIFQTLGIDVAEAVGTEDVFGGVDG
jgi:hypothetical protein